MTSQIITNLNAALTELIHIRDYRRIKKSSYKTGGDIIEVTLPEYSGNERQRVEDIVKTLTTASRNHPCPGLKKKDIVKDNGAYVANYKEAKVIFSNE